MPEDKGYPSGRKQSAVIKEVPMARKKTSMKRRGVRKK